MKIPQNTKRFKKESNEDPNDKKQAHFWELFLNKKNWEREEGIFFDLK